MAATTPPDATSTAAPGTTAPGTADLGIADPGIADLGLGRRLGIVALGSLTVLAGVACGPPALLPVFEFESPVCASNLVGVVDTVPAQHTRAEITDAVLATGWVTGNGEPTVVVVDRVPTIANHAMVAEAMEDEYPRALRFHGIGGTSTFAVLVDPTGRVTEIRLSRAARYPEFDEAAARVFAVMHFSPALYHGCRPFYWAELDLTFAVGRR